MKTSGSLKNIQAVLDGAEGLDTYRISERATVSYELFFVHRKLETVRSTDAAATQVTVYVDHDGKLGDSTFHVYPSMTSAEIAAKTAAAVSRAKLVFNEPYEPAPAGELEAALPTNLDEYAPEELGQKIADAVFAADVVPGGSINALEIFIYRDTHRVVNSRGVNKSQTVHRVMIEAIPTFTDERQSVELYEDYRFTRFDAAGLTAEISGKLKEAADRVRAVKPEHGFTTNVVLRPLEIEELVSELADDCNYRTIYDNANLHDAGDDLQPGDGDKLTVTMKAVVEGSESSAFFDDDGTSLTDTVIIKDGVVCGRYGGSRFGQYLGETQPSGNLGCIRLEPGTLTDAELAAEPYLECVSLSGIQLDLYNDYIGGEIRLAYLHEGDRTTPLTGITMSAKLSEVLATLRLHEQTCVYDEYEGPVKLLLKDVSVL